MARGFELIRSRHGRAEARHGRKSLLRDPGASGKSRRQDAAERVLVSGDDEQGVIQARDPDYSSDGFVDAGENQEAMKFEEAVMRRDKHTETRAVKEGHLRQVEPNDPAMRAFLLSQNVGEVFPCGKVELANSADGRTQRIEIDNSQLEPRIGFSDEGGDTSHDDAP